MAITRSGSEHASASGSNNDLTTHQSSSGGTLTAGDTNSSTRDRPIVGGGPAMIDPARMQQLRAELDQIKQQNDLLNNLVDQYQQLHGDNYEFYPPEVLAHLRRRQANAPASRQRDIGEPIISQPESVQTFNQSKNMDPEIYETRRPKELHRFLQACRAVFDHRLAVNPNHVPNPKSQITWAATFLRGDVADMWERHRRTNPVALETMSWEDFVTLLKNDIQQPDARRLDVSSKYNDARQRDSQTITTFVRYLEALEEELEPKTPEQLRDSLLNKMHSKYRAELLKNNSLPRIQTREELLSAVIMIEAGEALGKHTGKGPSSSRDDKGKGKEREHDPPFRGHSKERSHGSSFRGHGRKRTLGGSIKPAKPQREAGDSTEIGSSGPRKARYGELPTCFECGEKGHIRPNCPKSKDKTESSAKRL